MRIPRSASIEQMDVWATTTPDSWTDFFAGTPSRTLRRRYDLAGAGENEGHGGRRGQRRRDVRAGARDARLRGRRPRRHQGEPPAGQGARHQPDGRGARLRAERHRLERLRGDGRLGRRRRSPPGLPRSPGHEPRRPRRRRTRRSSARSPSRSSRTAPTRSIIVVSNPLDAMCHVAKNVSGFAEGACSAWPASSTPRASARSSPGRPARR